MKNLIGVALAIVAVLLVGCSTWGSHTDRDTVTKTDYYKGEG